MKRNFLKCVDQLKELVVSVAGMFLEVLLCVFVGAYLYQELCGTHVPLASAIAGAVVATVALLALIALGVIAYARWSKYQDRKAERAFADSIDRFKADLNEPGVPVGASHHHEPHKPHEKPLEAVLFEKQGEGIYLRQDRPVTPHDLERLRETYGHGKPSESAL